MYCILNPSFLFFILNINFRYITSNNIFYHTGKKKWNGSRSKSPHTSIRNPTVKSPAKYFPGKTRLFPPLNQNSLEYLSQSFLNLFHFSCAKTVPPKVSVKKVGLISLVFEERDPGMMNCFLLWDMCAPRFDRHIKKTVIWPWATQNGPIHVARIQTVYFFIFFSFYIKSIGGRNYLDDFNIILPKLIFKCVKCANL